MANHPPQPTKAKKRRIFLGTCLGLLLLAAVLHRPILRAIGDFLVVEDDLTQVDAMFVLSGNPFDRGREAARLYHDGWSPTVVCLGGEHNPALELYGIDDLTHESTRRVLQAQGVPVSAIDSLPEGTSTYEEFVAIAQYSKARQYDKVMVVSSRYHTRRIDAFFRLRLHLEGIDMVLRGSPETDIDEQAWWQSEPGLIFVNNEYIKYFYYWTRY